MAFIIIFFLLAFLGYIFSANEYEKMSYVFVSFWTFTIKREIKVGECEPTTLRVTQLLFQTVR